MKTEDVVNTSLIVEDPPEASMKTALAPTSISDAIIITIGTESDEDKLFYIYLYFAELYELKDGETREFTISTNGRIWRGPFSPTYLKSRVEFGTDTLPAWSPAERLNLVLEKTEHSTLPPLINAMEVYIFHKFSGKDTAAEDGMEFTLSILNYLTFGEKTNLHVTNLPI